MAVRQRQTSWPEGRRLRTGLVLQISARGLAARYDISPIGTEPMLSESNSTPARVIGAQELTKLVGLQATARVIKGDVLEVALPDASLDAVISQEAFCHVPELRKALVEAARILREGGRLAFTDWVANEPLSAEDAQLMWDGMAIQPLRSIAEYRQLVESSGLRVLSATDLTGEWGPILQERLAMYQRLREEARQAGTPMGHDAFHQSYIRFVELIRQLKLGGVRIVASK